MVSDMLEQGVIRPLKTLWVSLIVSVAKKDGCYRSYVDYQCLNSITKMNAFLLPSVDESLDILSKLRYFSTLDLLSGYWQVKVDQGSVKKVMFTTHLCPYEFLVMLISLCNASATF